MAAVQSRDHRSTDGRGNTMIKWRVWSRKIRQAAQSTTTTGTRSRRPWPGLRVESH